MLRFLFGKKKGVEVKDSDAVISHRKTLALRPPGHPNRSTTLINLGNALLTRFNQSGRIEDLEDAISSQREGLSLCPPGHQNRPTSLIILGNILYTRFQKFGKIKDMEEAISSHREALALCPPDHPNRPGSLTNLGLALHTRFKQGGRVEDLEDAISSQRKSLSLRPPGHPNRTASLRGLGVALNTRFDQSGRVEDLEDAISAHREALALYTPGHPECSTSLNNLGSALFARFNQLGGMEDLEDAISTHRKALVLYAPSHPERPTSLQNLSNALRTRFSQLGTLEDLEDTISSLREAITLCPPGHARRSIMLSSIGMDFYTRFNQLGRMEDLEDAISSFHEALTLYPPGHARRSIILLGIGIAYYTRFSQLSRIEDLEDTISFHREALSLHPPGHPNRFTSLNSLGNALDTRSNKVGKTEDLEEAILFHREALALCPPGHPDRPIPLNSLGSALNNRFKQLGRTEDLEGLISSYREVLTLRPPGHPDRPASLNNLSNALMARFDKLGRIEDVEDVISSHREVLTLRPPGHPDRSTSFMGLGSALVSRYTQLGRMDDLEESLTLYEQAATDLTSTSAHRAIAAIKWAATARQHHHKSTIFAYSISLRLFSRCLVLYPIFGKQHKDPVTPHSQVPMLSAPDAASAAIDAGELETAVELLEEGRAIMWSFVEGYRYPFDQLRQVDRPLADCLETLSIELGRLELSFAASPSLADLEAKMARRRKLSEEWEEVVGRARKIKGLANFLQAIPFQTLRAAAAEGPIVLINISKYRSDAIILHADNLRPILVPLPNVRPQDLTQLVEQFVLARDGGANDPSKLFLPILRNLWEDVISPVHDRLTDLGVPEKSRVWWCPTSELCDLPLHAAGPYRSGKKNLPDIYVSSYIKTISALIRGKSNVLSDSVAPKLLVIGQSATLPKVQVEINHIRQLLGDFVDVMIDAEANRDGVLHSLQHHSWAHFACHGRPGDYPYHASFELHGNDRLTILDLINARLPNAELAFLSACHSRAGDLTTPDEIIHLATALQFCGFRSVVGTLWAMHDEDGPTISKEFYKHMFRKPGNQVDFRDSAEALNLAIRAMRKNGVPLHRWIMFVHIGA